MTHPNLVPLVETDLEADLQQGRDLGAWTPGEADIIERLAAWLVSQGWKKAP